MKIFNYRNNGLHAFIFIASVSMSCGVHATCKAGTGNSDQTFNFPEIIVQRDLPVGQEIVSRSSVSGNIHYSCTNGGSLFLQMLLFPTASQYDGATYKTNIDGVGIKITNLYSYTNPATVIQGVEPGQTGGGVLMSPYVYLYKIGPTSSGTLRSGLLAKASGDNNIDLVKFYINSTKITTVACSINTPSIQVSLDSVQGKDLIAIGTTVKPKTFNLGLNCDPKARVNVKVSGEKNTDTTADGVLQLTGAGSNNVATGVGIQILYNNTPVILGSKIVLKTSSGGAETFPFTAQYYQTKAIPSSGSANTVATLDLTYE